jgi:D-tyrosyl-tRNA(Tyr) deacylase
LKAVLQRVAWARVRVGDEVVGEVGQGLLVLLGVERGDSERDAAELAERLAQYRVFADDRGRMNLSVEDVRGGVLVVSQFTLCADVSKGRRPSFDPAEAPERAEALYHSFAAALTARGLPVATGRFGAHMRVESCNDGPVTFLFERRTGAAAGPSQAGA